MQSIESNDNSLEMKISFNWVKQFLNIDLPTVEVSEILTNLGLEVEGVTTFESVKGGLEGVIVGEVLSCYQHPDADRLKVTQVDLGNKKVQIVCGATNVAKGQKVAVATVGSTLYDNDGVAFKIKKSKIRGQESLGMICAEDELGLGASHEEIMVLSCDLNPGSPCSEVFNIEKDYVFEIGLTPNRSDAMSHMGVARDLKALCVFEEIDFEWNPPNAARFKIENTTKIFPVTVENTDLAPTYAGITISDIKVKPSPKWLQNRLKAIGLNPKNNIIDITNYILHDLGQPLHAFDLDKLEGGIVVKTVAKGTPFTTLDGVERKLNAEDLMICDQKKPLCIAGVFGGLESGVNDKTTSIFLESAYFDPISIRKTVKRHSLNTDASFRYERGIDPEITEFALKCGASMIVEIAGGFITSEIEAVTQEQEPAINFMLNYEDVWRTIGQKISIDDLIKILNALEIRINQTTKNGIFIEIPKYRVDVTRPVDVIEEILRVYGYNKIETPDTLHSNLPKDNHISEHNTAELMSKQLVSQGFSEMINNSITSPSYVDLSESISKIAPVIILNPMGKELSQLRTSLLPSALEVIAFNLKRQSKRLKFFELGKVYQEKNDGYEESKFISLIFTGTVYEENWNVQNQPGDFFFFKGILNQLIQKKTAQEWIESPTKEDVYTEGLNYKINNKMLLNFGYVKDDILKKFDIDQAVLYAELDIEFLFDLTLKNKLKFNEIPKYPVSRRDFALLLNEEVAFNEIKSLALKTEKNILKEIKLFDVYIGKNLPEGKKSYGVSFYFQDKKKTLTDKYMDQVMNTLKQSFESELGAQLR